MRILFFSHYFPPEGNAPASRTFDHCRRWVRDGHQVTIVTCVPNVPNGVPYEGFKNRWRKQTEIMDGLHVVRIWTYLAPNAGRVGRILNFLSYFASASLAAIFMRRPDVIVATSPQFFCGWAGVIVAWLKRVPLVLEIRDIWPESIETVGAISNRRLLGLLERMERWMYRAATHLVTVGNGYRDNILQKVDVSDRISVIYNGVDLQLFSPREPDVSLLREQGLENKFVCSYVGTIGMAHGLEVVVDAARLLAKRNRRDIVFCLVGDGAFRGALEREVREAGLQDLVVFMGRQAKEDIPRILASSSACLIHLKKCELFATVIPSKIFESMAMEKPIVMGVLGEAREIVMRANAAILMEPEDAASLVDAVERLADSPQLTHQLGSSARAFVATHYSRDASATAYLDILEQVVSHRGRLPRKSTTPVKFARQTGE